MMKNVLIWVVAISLAAISGSTAVGAIAKTKSPKLALSFLPQNGFAAQTIVSSLATASVAENMGKFPDPVSSSWTAMALQAFRAEAISPDAIAVVALSRSGNVRRELMQKAFELSRRQKIVTGWLISDSGKRGELSAVLDYYDILLRTSSSANSVVMPAMAAALSDDGSIEPLTGLLSKKPPWALRFWQQVSSTQQAFGNAVQLRKRLYEPNELSENYSDPELIRNLIKSERFSEAEELYNLLSQASTSGSLIKYGSFEHEPKYPPLDWQLFSTGEYGATIADDHLQISAIANSGGLFARQLVKIPSGLFQMESKFASKISDNFKMELRLTCAETDTKPRFTVRLPLNDQTEQQQISSLQSDCKYYWLEIAGRASENGNGFDTVLEYVSLRSE